MRPRDLTALEFDQVRSRLADFARSLAGKELCHALVPSVDRVTVARTLDATHQCVRLLDAHGELPLGAFADIRAALRTASHEGFVLDGRSLLDIRSVLEGVRVTRAFLEQRAGAYSQLAHLPEQLSVPSGLLRSLARALDDNGDVTDDASDELASVRRALRHLRDQLTRRLDGLLARPAMADLVADRYVTIRNGRFVIPIRTAAAGQLDGVVQDRSVSGETTFIEPLFAVEMNNRLLMAAKEEEALVRRILADLTDLLRSEHARVTATFAALAEIDALAARARFARHYRCTPPQLNDEEIAIRDARHPVLLFAERTVTPIDLLLPPGKQVLVITGPNTGGKTVALKTLGVLALMAQSGLLIPAAEGSRLPCFEAVYADVGDEQSIERNLSTFSAHIANLTEIIGQRKHPVLVLLDEPGVGTDPEEGAALGIGMIRTLAASDARVVVSTHYVSIKVFALSNERCTAAAVDFDLAALQPRYRLVYHSIGESLALPIARRLGLPEAVLHEAHAARSANARALAAAMSELEASRRRYEERALEAEEHARAASEARREADALLDELRGKRRRVWTDELEAARAFVRSLRDEGRQLLAALERGEAERRTFGRVLQSQEAAIVEREAAVAHTQPAVVTSASPPGVGDQVEVGGQGIRGELLAVNGERAWIQRGSLRFEVPAAALRRIERKPQPTVAMHVAPAPEGTPREISLVGLRAREAIAALDDFLDHATRARHASVRIIHGIGSGALRRAVEDYLATSPYCVGFRAGGLGEGGTGVTVADLAT
jgi:DNA mismatch repair protein MutS2